MYDALLHDTTVGMYLGRHHRHLALQHIQAASGRHLLCVLCGAIGGAASNARVRLGLGDDSARIACLREFAVANDQHALAAVEMERVRQPRRAPCIVLLELKTFRFPPGN